MKEGDSHKHTQHHHHEEHFQGSEMVRDIVIGMSDGLTVPFALAAGLSGGLSGMVDQTHIIVTAGLAEIAAGSIAMGLGGFLAARGDSEHYTNEEKREYREVETVPEREEQEIIDLFVEYGVKPEESRPVVDALKRNKKAWVDFMMKFELGLEKPDPKRAYSSAATIAGSYIAGGIIPLFPYMMFDDAHKGLLWSVAMTLTALFVFGIIKGRFTGIRPLKAGLETLFIGGLAAAAAYFIAKTFS